MTLLLFFFGILGTVDQNLDFTLMFSKLLPCLSALELQFSCRTGTGSRKREMFCFGAAESSFFVEREGGSEGEATRNLSVS